MHIVFVISTLAAGGAERVLSKLANYLVKAHTVSIITYANPTAVPFYPLEPAIQLLQLDLLTKKKTLWLKIILLLQRLLLLRRAIKSLNPDLVITFMDTTNITTLLATIGLDINIIVSERTDPNYHKVPWIVRKLRTLTYRLARHIVVQTTSAASYFKAKVLQDKITIIPNSVTPPPKYKTITAENPLTLITVGRLCQDKGFHILITAFAMLANKYPNNKLIIYGSGPEEANLKDLINSFNLQHRITLAGLTKNIYDQLTDADIFIFPSFYEGFPNALCEAMSVGLPVIASDCSGNKDIIRDGVDGLLFERGNTMQLVAKLDLILQDTELRAHIAKAASEVTSRFNEHNINTLWEKILCR